MTAAAGPVDVEGGWYDAPADFLKFTHTTAYALIAMAARCKRDGPAPAGLGRREPGHGLDWLDKDVGNENARDAVHARSASAAAWTPRTTASSAITNTWRLPGRPTTSLDVQPGDDHYYQRYRPVFRGCRAGLRR